MKLEEMRTLSVDDLVKKIGEAHQELFNLRLKLSTRQLANHRELPRVRREIARMETILREKQLSQAAEKQA